MRGAVKIIDFGIARATDSDIAVTTMHTDVRELIGTLQYMSPEQCAGDPRDLDIRSDVYSLGVVLYELLCGQLPYDLSHTPIPQATRVIQETDPPRPSTISKRLKGNLEAIVLKALEKDRAKRFQSTADLVRNIRNHLAGEPLDIRPPTRFFVAIHWLVKHPIITTSAACFAIAAIVTPAIIIGATLLSTRYINTHPHHIELTPDGREARLMSVGNNILHTWKTKAERGIRFAQLVQRPSDLGGGKLALVGFNSNVEIELAGALCAFSLGDFERPIWSRRITNDDLLPQHVEDKYKTEGFGIACVDVQDVFPERPGLEVITNYQHAPGSACAIRIYDLSGEVLYQIWHDGSVGGRYWMAESRLLFLCGLNSEVYWPQRGYPELRRAHPVVVFAVRPTLGHVGGRIVTSTPGGDMATLAFYKCLLPARAVDLIAEWPLHKPSAGEDASRFVRLGLMLLNTPGAEVSWLIDETGLEVPNSRRVNDAWELEPNPPEPELFYLGELPPIILTTE